MLTNPFRWNLGDVVCLAEKDNRDLPPRGEVVALELRPNGTWASVKWLKQDGGYVRTVEPETSLRTGRW